LILKGCFTEGAALVVLDKSGILKVSMGFGIKDSSVTIGRLIVLYFLESTVRYWMGPPELFF
jgi:hypothetical protein